jgi:hypothetical protein
MAGESEAAGFPDHCLCHLLADDPDLFLHAAPLSLVVQPGKSYTPAVSFYRTMTQPTGNHHSAVVVAECSSLSAERKPTMKKQEITGIIKARFAGARERGKVLGQALKVRADIAAVRRRLRSTFAELGEEVYGKMEAGKVKGWGDTPEFAEFKARIEGLKAELDQRERKLAGIMEGKEKAAVGEEQDKSEGGKVAQKKEDT